MDDMMTLKRLLPGHLMPSSPYVDMTHPSTGRSVELAWGHGETADVRFDFKIEWAARKLRGHLCLLPRDGSTRLSTSDARAAFFSGYNGIIAVYRIEQDGQNRDIIITANESLYSEPARLQVFSSAVYTLEEIVLGGQLISGEVYVETPWKDKVTSKASFTKDSKDEPTDTKVAPKLSHQPPKHAVDIPGLHLAITNLNGNSNELEFTPADISQIQGNFENINSESVKQFVQTIQMLKEHGTSESINISIPIYIINITNVLTNGSKNSIQVE